jgi:hypothetical protein
MASNARKHTIPAGADTSVSRDTIFEDFGNSIRDVVPVANTTERTQLVTALTNANPTQAPSATRPLVVHRADAPGLHRLEYTINGTVWLPASGTLFFASKAAADSWGTANGGYLSIGDKARVGSLELEWTGTAWAGDWIPLTLTANWVNFGSAYQIARCRRINGVVYVEGLIKDGNPAAGAIITTLPVGHRPAAYLSAVVWGNGSAWGVDVSPTGQIVSGGVSTFNTSLFIPPFAAA